MSNDFHHPGFILRQSVANLLKLETSDREGLRGHFLFFFWVYFSLIFWGI